MDITEEEYLGGVAYNAYCDTTGWKSAVTGATLPDFRSEPEAVKTGWIAAAQAVVNSYNECAWSYPTERVLGADENVKTNASKG